MLFRSCALMLLGVVVSFKLAIPAFVSLNLDPLNRFVEPSPKLDIKPRSVSTATTIARTQADAETWDMLLSLHRGKTLPCLHRMIERQTYSTDRRHFSQAAHGSALKREKPFTSVWLSAIPEKSRSAFCHFLVCKSLSERRVLNSESPSFLPTS